jgi:hypothetical protein
VCTQGRTGFLPPPPTHPCNEHNTQAKAGGTLFCWDWDSVSVNCSLVLLLRASDTMDTELGLRIPAARGQRGGGVGGSETERERENPQAFSRRECLPSWRRPPDCRTNTPSTAPTGSLKTYGDGGAARSNGMGGG